MDNPLTCEGYCTGPKTDGAEVGSPQTCADRWSRGDQQQGGRQHGMSREQMCPFVRAVNMSHSTLKMPEGHGELYRGGRKWEGNKNAVGVREKKKKSGVKSGRQTQKDK